jgi:opacity protein-like surface antigen
MRIVRSFILGAVLLALTPGVVRAQDHKVHFNFGGGPTFAGGDLGNAFKTGWGPAVGLTFDVTPRVGIQFEYAYRWFSASDYVDAIGGKFSANHKTHQFDFNFVANLTPPDSPARVYVVAGPGAYQRNVEITKYAGTGIVCDPWFYICGAYPVDAVLGSRGSWDFGFNVGGGVGFRFPDGGEFYIESRFHYVVGKDVTSSVVLPTPLNGVSGSTRGYYYPLTFGFRF